MCVFKCEKNILAVIICLIIVSFSNAQVYNMGNLGSISTCSGYFYDDGGSGNNYSSGQTTVATFCSASPGQSIYFQFTQFKTENFYDSLIVYNGSSTSDPIIGAYTGSTVPGNIISSNASNCLTFEFRSDGSIQDIGWVATIGCGTPPPAPLTPCDGAAAFCTGTNYNFPAATGTTAQVGPDYDCLFTQPNPVWYFLQIQNGGNLGISMANTANVDVDFVLWGPFTSSAACNQLTGANVVDCSYSGAATEHIDITGAVPGQYYMLCVTNYSNQPTNFTLTTDGSSTASTNCAILCDITSMTAGAGACDVTTGTHSITGNVITQFPPSTGTLTITTNTGQSVVLNAPFSGNTAYTLPGIPSTGGIISVTAQFSTDTGCNYTTTYTAPASCLCSVTASNNSPTCQGGSVTLSAAVQGTVTTYQWTGPNSYSSSQQNPVITGATPLQAGTYVVSVTAGGCTAVDSTVVIVGPTPTLTPTITPLTCNGAANGSILASTNAVAPVAYQWSGGVATNYPSDSVITGLAAGTYNVTATGANGCSVTGTYQVTQPTALVLGTPTITQATCNTGGTITASASGGTAPYAYSWSNSGTTPNISNLAAGPYILTVYDANQCSVTAIYNVTAAPNAITFGAATINDAQCAGSADGSIQTTVSGGVAPLTYVWSNNQTTPNNNNIQAGTYTLNVTDVNGCSASVSYTVGGSSALVFNPAVTTVVTCQSGGSITADVTGGASPYTYNWSNQMQGAYISNLPAGDYTVTATDANGCTAADMYTVGTDPTAIAITNPQISDVSCVGATDGSINVTFVGGTGTVTGVWSNQQTGNNISNLAAGTYSVTASDPTGCSASATYTINGPQGLTTNTPSVVDAICYQSPTGSIDVNPVGGTPPYNYLWSDSQTAKTATNLVAGTYTVTITDANGCNTTVSGDVKEPNELVIDSLVATPIKCANDINGTITAYASGGTQPYNYSATQDGTAFYYANGGYIEGLPVGLYTVIISDNNGCTVADTTSVGGVIPDEFIVTTDSTSCYGNDYNDGEIHIVALSEADNGPYWYSIDGGAQQQQSGDFFGLLAGAYKIQAVSDKGCTSTIEATVEQPLQMFADINPDTLTLELGESGDVLATYQNASNVMYSWGPSYGLSCSDCPNPTITAYNRTDYVLTISMQNGDAVCYAKAKLHVGVEEAEFMYVPNAFTPNGDGNNDLFLVYSQDIQKVNVKIFNRWGELVFESLNQFHGWDGTYKGTQSPEGLYTYTVQATRLDNTKAEKNGSIMLIR